MREKELAVWVQRFTVVEIVVGDGRTVKAYGNVVVKRLPPGPVDESLRFNPAQHSTKDGRLKPGVDPNTGRQADKEYQGR